MRILQDLRYASRQFLHAPGFTATAILTLGALSSGGLASASTGSGAVDDRIAELERQIAELRALVASNQQTITVQEETITANSASIATNTADIEEARPMAKGTKFTYGGYIQLDAISSSYSDGRPNELIEDFYVPSLVPVEPADGNSDSYTSTNLHAKTSRFFFTTCTRTAFIFVIYLFVIPTSCLFGIFFLCSRVVDPRSRQSPFSSVLLQI